jgi:hypothetical protein
MMRFTIANDSLSLILSHSSINEGEGSSTSGKKSYKQHVSARSRRLNVEQGRRKR